MNNVKRLCAYAGVRELIEKNGINQAFNSARVCSYEGIELLYLTDECDNIIDEADAFLSAMRESGIKVACISCYADVVTKTAPYTKDTKSIEAIKRCIELAHRIGCPAVHHTLVTRLHGTKEAYGHVLEAVVSAAEEIADYAECLGIDILYEPQGMLFNGLTGYSVFFDIMRTRHKNVGMCLDVGNTLWVDEDCYALAERYAQCIKHVHVKDYVIGIKDGVYKTLGGKAIEEVALGEGIIDLKRVLDILGSASYQGYISIEDNSGMSFDVTAENARQVLGSL